MPLSVPHRAEHSDTLAYVVHGPARSAFYCPDIDGWDRWQFDLSQFLINILNHSNPLWRAEAERVWLEERGLKVGRAGMQWTI